MIPATATRRLSLSDADQIAGRSFQPDGEEQEYGADFGDGVDRVAGQNKAGGVGAEHHAR